LALDPFWKPCLENDLASQVWLSVLGNHRTECNGVDLHRVDFALLDQTFDRMGGQFQGSEIFERLAGFDKGGSSSRHDRNPSPAHDFLPFRDNFKFKSRPLISTASRLSVQIFLLSILFSIFPAPGSMNAFPLASKQIRERDIPGSDPGISVPSLQAGVG